MEATIRSGFRGLSAAQLATLAVQMARDPLRGTPAPEPPDRQTAFLPADGARWRLRRRVRDGAEPLEAALCARAHGLALQEVTACARRRRGRGIADALAGVYACPAGEGATEPLALWVFRSAEAARDYAGALADSGQDDAIAGARGNLVVTGIDGEPGAAARAAVAAYMDDLLGPVLASRP